MRLKTDRAPVSTGLTMLEAIIAMTIMAILMAVFVPQFRTIQNSWASKQGTAETVQNARVLTHHLYHNLSTANKIIAVSDPSETNGYIEFQDNHGNTMRYDISADNYIEFGPVGNLANLGGPVNMLQFTCYDAIDLDTPITTAEDIRCVKVQSIVGNTAPLGSDFPLAVQAYIRTNMGGTGTDVEEVVGSEILFDGATGEKPAICQIDATHYLCAYTGSGWDGWAVVLTVDPTDWTVTKGLSFEFDVDSGESPALSQIDATHYLCAYGGWDGPTAVVLTVNPADYTITRATPFIFDLDGGKDPALYQIDATHHLCVYEGKWNAGWAVVLTVDTGTWAVTKETSLEFDALKGMSPSLSRIDVDDYLCAYRGSGDDGYVVVFTVDAGDFSITMGTPLEFDTKKGHGPTLSKIDANHFLCAYQGDGDDGWAVVLTIDTSNKTITKETELEFDMTKASDPVLSKESDEYYLCAYEGSGTSGTAIVLAVDATDWTISAGQSVQFDNNCHWPDLIRVGEHHHLCAYEGSTLDGWAVVLEAGGELLP